MTFGKFVKKRKLKKIQLPKNWKKKKIYFSCLIGDV